ncbi:MAG: hypothetical protein ACK2T6_02945, partial [Anaerolineae bacterium]
MAANRIATAGLLAAVALAAALGAPGAAAQPSCRHVAVRSPFPGETVSGRVPILGSAEMESFHF